MNYINLLSFLLYFKIRPWLLQVPDFPEYSHPECFSSSEHWAHLWIYFLSFKKSKLNHESRVWQPSAWKKQPQQTWGPAEQSSGLKATEMQQK